ncbi:MAG: transcription antitermination factor NusB [Cetobacterium sp.]|uniref:transcription antitermination factor NusB n=1 Tax=unclassified Cetobacterium TaxID=2630983 RepID=UPI00163CAD4C|nr:transcription antitermination factor NusB [Cetobacterium sp. 2A]MBC2855987.1 transcription antitermination factor NusB [Cetobacterium sp. 2A]
MSRRLAREELFKLVFEVEVNEDSLGDVLENYLSREEVQLNENERSFIVKYAKGMAENNDEVMAVLEDNISGWTFERVGNIEKALLKVSTYEILFEDTPAEIIINEAVELAKKYGDEKSHEFVNGVLAKVLSSRN